MKKKLLIGSSAIILLISSIIGVFSTYSKTDSDAELNIGAHLTQSSEEVPDPTRTIYFYDNYNWSNDNSTTKIYMYNSSNSNINAAFPGQFMTKIGSIYSSFQRNYYSYTYDSSLYDMCIFVRCSSAGTAWNQTPNLTIQENKSAYLYNNDDWSFPVAWG